MEQIGSPIESHGQELCSPQTLEDAVRDVQKYFAQFSDGESWSEELIGERRAVPQNGSKLVKWHQTCLGNP